MYTMQSVLVQFAGIAPLRVYSSSLKLPLPNGNMSQIKEVFQIKPKREKLSENTSLLLGAIMRSPIVWFVAECVF